MNPRVAHLRRQSAQRKYIKRLRYVRVLWVAVWLLLVVLAVEVLCALCFSPRFWIFRIAVTGGDTLKPPEVTRLAAVPLQTNYYRISLGEVTRRIAQEPRVLHAEVHHGPIGALQVHIEERRAVCRLGDAQPPRYLDAYGVLFSRPQAPTPPVPVVEGIDIPTPRDAFGKPVTDARMQTVLECLDAQAQTFEGGAPLAISRVLVASNGRLSLVLAQGARIWLGAPTHLRDKWWVVRNTILTASAKGYALDQLDYIDARVYHRATGYSAEFKVKRNREATSP